MSIFQAIFIAIVEGLTEFLPISSTGHMILASKLLGIPSTEFQKSFEIFIQLGAILAVVVVFFKRVVSDVDSWKKTLAAFMPSAILSFLFYGLVKEYLLHNDQIVIASLFIGGILILLFDTYHKEKNTNSKDQTISCVSYKNAILIGLCQTIALIPGVSRSAATIIGALALGENRKTAVQFSFLLAIPTMVAAAGYDFMKTSAVFTSNEYMLLGVGFLVAFITALCAIKLFLGYIQNKDFKVFGVYRIIIAIIYFIIIS